RNGGLRGAGEYRAAGDRRASSQTYGRRAAATDPAGGGDLAPGSAGKHEPRDCGSTIHQPEHGRVPPAQGVPKTGSEIADGAGSSDCIVSRLLDRTSDK